VSQLVEAEGAIARGFDARLQHLLAEAVPVPLLPLRFGKTSDVPAVRASAVCLNDFSWRDFIHRPAYVQASAEHVVARAARADRDAEIEQLAHEYNRLTLETFSRR